MLETQAQTLSVRGELGRLLRLSGPMMLAQGGLVTMGLIDTWAVGRVSTEDMAGVALGNALSFVLIGTVIGLSMGIEPLVAQSFGASESRRARAWRVQGVWTVLLVSLPATLGLLGLTLLVPAFGLSEGFDRETQLYLLGRTPGLVLTGLYSVYRCYLTSVGRSTPALVAVFVANLVNAGLDGLFLFVFDWGAFGVGLATSLSAAGMLVVCALAVAEAAHPDDRRPSWADIRSVLRLGWPIGAQMGAEVGVFSIVSSLIALEGQAALAGHQIALGLASLTFMAAVGIAVGATARVGHHVGAGHLQGARTVGLGATALGALFMALGGVVFITAPEILALSFAPEAPEVREAAVIFLRIAAAFAISDGVQAVAAGALRGAGDTHSPLVANLVGHGVVGLPLGLGLARGLGLGAEGYWWGITAGLTVTAGVLVERFVRLTSRPISRVEVSSPSPAPAGAEL